MQIQYIISYNDKIGKQFLAQKCSDKLYEDNQNLNQNISLILSLGKY